MSDRPALLFYCQHSLGMGHLARSLALASELTAHFRVVLLNGGKLPRGIAVPRGVEVVNLPPLGFDEAGRLVCRDGRRNVERTQSKRRAMLLDALRATAPRAVIVELFPFGRKKFASELLPFLEAAREGGGPRPLVVSSLRDILVGRADQAKHDARAVELANRYFDAVLVHSDPRFARIEESLAGGASLRVPVYYTGFVAAHAELPRRPRRRNSVVVSVGGGIVGAPLLRAAADAHRLLRACEQIQTTLVAGPFLPEDAWSELRETARSVPGLTVRRFVRDLALELRGSAASISQCGYNTALDILRSETPALVVPFGEGEENEQARRALRLEQLGALRVLRARELSPERLAGEIRELRAFEPRSAGLDLDGARAAARLVAELEVRQ